MHIIIQHSVYFYTFRLFFVTLCKFYNKKADFTKKSPHLIICEDFKPIYLHQRIFKAARYFGRQALFILRVIVEISLNEHDGSPFVSAAGGEVAERADQIGELAWCCSLRRHIAL